MKNALLFLLLLLPVPGLGQYAIDTFDLPHAPGHHSAISVTRVFLSKDTSYHMDSCRFDHKGRVVYHAYRDADGVAGTYTRYRFEGDLLLQTEHYGGPVHIVSETGDDTQDSSYHDANRLTDRNIYHYSKGLLQKQECYWQTAYENGPQLLSYTLYTWDSLRRLRSALSITPPRENISYSYRDDRGRLVVRDADTMHIRYRYADSIREEWTSHPFLGSPYTLTTYLNKAGLPLRTVSRRGKGKATEQARYRYDAQGRLTEYRWLLPPAAGSGAVFPDKIIYAYDAEGKRTAEYHYRKGGLYSDVHWTYRR